MTEENLKEIYNISDKYDKETSSYFSIVDKKCEGKDFIDLFLTSQNISITKESRFAIISKLVFLKNDKYKTSVYCRMLCYPSKQ